MSKPIISIIYESFAVQSVTYITPVVKYTLFTTLILLCLYDCVLLIRPAQYLYIKKDMKIPKRIKEEIEAIQNVCLDMIDSEEDIESWQSWQDTYNAYQKLLDGKELTESDKKILGQEFDDWLTKDGWTLEMHEPECTYNHYLLVKFLKTSGLIKYSNIL